MRQPIRWIQTNLRQTDANLDAKQLVNSLVDYKANVLLIGMGGIAAYYPTKVPFHYPSPQLPPGRDMFGDVLAEAHRNGIKVVGRFDLSKTQKAAYDAHPEWFFRKADGQPVIFNELYSVCINGGYYRDQGMKILAEALDRYEVDGLFFNMFGNQSRDYAGNFVGHCHCDSCKRKFRERYHRDLPKEPDDDYREFMFKSSREVAAAIGDLIHKKRPQAGYFNYIQEYTDGIMSESNTAVNRPLPLWPYASSDNVNRARNSQPGKMSVNLCMQFVDYAWRWATVPPQEISLRLWQNVAHGGALALAINGTFDQEDRQALTASKPVFHWLAKNEQYYMGQQSAARVLVLGAPASGGAFSQSSYRGIFRFLSEEHIPFAVSNNLDWIGKRNFDLVIATDWAPKELENYARNGGQVLLVSSRIAGFAEEKIVKRWNKVEGYFRVRDHSKFPSLKLTNVMMLNGDYLELENPSNGLPALTLVPPSMIGPPENIHIDAVNTTKPGIVTKTLGSGRYTWIPWDLGELYYKHSLSAHAGLLRDSVDQLLDERRQVKSDAHPLVEMSLMTQDKRTLLHLINLSGHSSTAYFSPVAMANIAIEIKGTFHKARTIDSATTLKLEHRNGYTRFLVPKLQEYELVVLE